MSHRSVHSLILMVDNEFGVLTRITALVRREGWNIKSLAVAETLNPTVSRLTISVECVESTLPHVLERLGRLACVRSIEAFSDASHISRELVLVTVGGTEKSQVAEAARATGAQVIDCCGEMLTLEFSGAPEQAENLLAALKPFGIINVARSGVVALERPAEGESV